MPNVSTVNVDAQPNILEILMKVADPNAFLIQTVHETRLVFEINVEIRVQERADKVLSAKLSIIFPLVRVLKVLVEIHSAFAEFWIHHHLNQLILAIQHRADLTVIVAMLANGPFVHAYLTILEHRHNVGPSVL